MPNDQEALVVAVVKALVDIEARVAGLEAAYLKPSLNNPATLKANLAECQRKARAGKKEIHDRLLREMQISLGNASPEKTT